MSTKKRKQYTNLEIKLHHLEKSSNKKPVKDEKYKTQKHLIEQLELLNEEMEFTTIDNFN